MGCKGRAEGWCLCVCVCVPVSWSWSKQHRGSLAPVPSWRGQGSVSWIVLVTLAFLWQSLRCAVTGAGPEPRRPPPSLHQGLRFPALWPEHWANRVPARGAAMRPPPLLGAGCRPTFFTGGARAEGGGVDFSISVISIKDLPRICGATRPQLSSCPPGSAAPSSASPSPRAHLARPASGISLPQPGSLPAAPLQLLAPFRTFSQHRTSRLGPWCFAALAPIQLGCPLPVALLPCGREAGPHHVGGDAPPGPSSLGPGHWLGRARG